MNLDRHLNFHLAIDRDDDFFMPFHDFNNLSRTRGGMGFDFPTHRPVVGIIVMVHIANQEAGLGFVDDDTDVAACTNRPKPFVLGTLNPMETMSFACRI
jgi:hypothetical protein